MLPDEVLQNWVSAKEFLKQAFQPLIYAVNALCDMRRKAPTTVTVNIRGRAAAYATLWTNGSFTMPQANGLVFGLYFYTTIMAVVPGGWRGSRQLPSRLAGL